ncbi:MAG: class I SAM-dependent methyltransferase [Actinomycetota bacterium]
MDDRPTSPTKAELAAEWASIAPAWIDRVGSAGDNVRANLLDEWMLDVVGDVTDIDVIDLGCGEGRFCRMLGSLGARVLGVDLQPAFVEHARAAGSPNERYLVDDMESLAGVDDDGFDLAVSYISLVDVADLGAVARQARRVLHSDGRLVVCNLAPMTTAVHRIGWVRDEERTKLHYPVDHYADEGVRSIPLAGGALVTNFHRMLSTTVNAFLDAGFSLRRLHEPVPDDDQIRRLGDDDLRRVPGFVIYDLVACSPA